jgi:hypothetical protein
MKKILQLKKIAKPNDIVVFDMAQRVFIAQPGAMQFVQGNYFAVGDQELSGYASDRNLYLQWNDRRWNFKDLASKIRYAHDFQKKMTTFSVENVSIQYPAWWANDPTFDPNEPERDEDEDLFAYVASLAHNEPLQQSLINTWDK